MKARIYKKNYLDTNNDLIGRLKLLLESEDEETYYKRFNDVYSLEFTYDEIVEFLKAKSCMIKSSAIENVIFPAIKYNEEIDDYEIYYNNTIKNRFYNNYKIAYHDDGIDFEKTYNVGELKSLVSQGKIVLLYNEFGEQVMNDDIFMEDLSAIYPFSEYPFPNLKILDKNTRKIVMSMIYMVVPRGKIVSDINHLTAKVKKIGTIK